MSRSRTRFLVAVVAASALVMGACGGDSSDAAAATTTSTSTAPSSTAGGETSGDSSVPVDDADSATDESTGTEQSAGAGDLSLVPEGETDIMGNPAGQGFVELSGVRYDVILNGACQRIFGAVQAAGALADGSDGGADSIIPPEGWESDSAAEWDPPYVAIEVGDDNWRAEVGSEHLVGGENVALTPEQSSVTSFSNDGSRVVGEAVFYSTYNYEEIETASGSFEFYCP